MTCRECGRAFKRLVRRGVYVTCPSCGCVQEGPEGIERIMELAKRQVKRMKSQRNRARPPRPPAPAPPAPAPVPPPAGGFSLRSLLDGSWEG